LRNSSRTSPGAPRQSSVETGSSRIETFRIWLRRRINQDPRSLHAIEVDAGIPGNALGKFLRGERGAVHSLTPMNIQRLAPVLLIGEVELLFRAGHLTYEPNQEPLEAAILASTSLDDNGKLLMLAMHARLSQSPRPTLRNDDRPEKSLDIAPAR
jgi:hypothetical protein